MKFFIAVHGAEFNLKSPRNSIELTVNFESTMKNQTSTLIASGVTYIAYGVDVKDNFDSPYALNSYDVWFDEDYNFFFDNMLDDLWDEIESDITSVWSTNLSEQLS